MYIPVRPTLIVCMFAVVCHSSFLGSPRAPAQQPTVAQPVAASEESTNSKTSLTETTEPDSTAAEPLPPIQLTFDPALFLSRYCIDCHDGDAAEAHLDLAPFQILDHAALERVAVESHNWNKIAQRVRDGDMPPEGVEAPELEERELFAEWVRSTLHQAACSDGIAPGPAPMRRLNRSEYAATIRELLNIHIDAGEALPAEGSGGEGFDNAAETLFISPLHAEKYLDAAKVSLSYAFTDPQARGRFLVAQPSGELTPTAAARQVLERFLPRAFRRPVAAEELQDFVELFELAYSRDTTFEPALQLTLEAVLISPAFLFRIEAENESETPVLLTDHEIASRLSYFLWGSMPDDHLLQVANEGRLNNPEELQRQVKRMLQDQERVRQFAQSFTEQWLGTRALGREFKPDPSIAQNYDSELEGGMKYEPILFFLELLTKDLSLLNLIDSDFTILNGRLARHYQLQGNPSAQPDRVELPADSPRGGLLGMAGVLAVSSHPYRTSPVLRGKWVLESMLGSPPPPAPPDVPELEEMHGNMDAKSLRERLELHRQDPACASCHARIDPLGFGLENFDVLGRWRTEDNGTLIDSQGQLADGTSFQGPTELKQVLLSKKEQVMRNLTAKMLGYALGRGLQNEDYCTVDQIVNDLGEHEYQSHRLILGIVQSVPFRYKAGTNPKASAEVHASASAAEGSD